MNDTLLIQSGLPEGFLDVSAREVHTLLPQPTLITCPGERQDALFVTILQHGNEDTGLSAVQALLREYRHRPLPRRLLLFVANVQAAREAVRHLPGQMDFNRAWPGTDHAPCAETRLMQAVYAAVATQPLFAAIDVHNNTGSNPHYAAFNRLDRRCVQLARVFSNTMVYFEQPHGVMTQALVAHCPAVVLECGKVGNAAGTEHARAFIDACLNMPRIPDDPVGSREVDLFHSVARLRLTSDAEFGFNTPHRQLSLDPDIDKHNFQELPYGTVLGSIKGPLRDQLQVLDEAGNDATDRYLSADDGELRLQRSVMPSMLTLDEEIVRQDCLCYFMERVTAEIS
jgi:succinylglutamate desuccinylase